MFGKRALFFIVILTSCTKKAPQPPAIPVQLKELQGGRVSEIKPAGPGRTSFKLHTDAEYIVNTYSGLDEDSAKSLMRQKLFLVRGLFQEEKSPYPGMTSNRISCPKSYQPVISEMDGPSQSSLRIQLYANTRKVYGVCSEEQARFKSVYLFVYCKRSRTAAQVEVYSEDRKNWEQWLVPGDCL